MRLLVSFSLLLITSFVYINHIGAVIPFEVQKNPSATGREFPRSESSHRHIVLEGADYDRGLFFGEKTREALLSQEALMVSKLDQFMGNSFIQSLFFTFAMVWFYDADKFIDRDSLKEMQGVSVFAPKKYDYLASGLTRQVAYHGLHEVGQMFVDQEQVDMGCFGALIKSSRNSWVVGRNFDFDIEGMFDREKLLKWVYPEDGIPFVSVIWGGMVGVVTGVNREGLFVSINAAGSDDFRRVGTPTTILVKNILTKSKSLEEAINILEKTQVFITDIFILADRKTKRVAIVEKSPKKMFVHYPKESEVVANHLRGEIWKEDENNENRKTNLTSDSRYRRGLELVKEKVFLDPIQKMVEVLRDRNLPDGIVSHDGHRGAIDSFIASQSVFYDLDANTFYVNLGPGTTGKYIGYDLEKSFSEKMPTLKEEIPSTMSKESYDLWQGHMKRVGLARKFMKKKNCEKTKLTLVEIPETFIHYEKDMVMGDYQFFCAKDYSSAKVYWKKALSYHPAYKSQRDELRGKLE